MSGMKRIRKNKLSELNDTALFVQWANNLLLTVSFVVLPLMWSKIITTSSRIILPNYTYDPWADINHI